MSIIQHNDYYTHMNDRNLPTAKSRPLSKQGSYLLLSFFIPFCVIMIALAGLSIAPFGDKTLVISDADGYYINFLSYAGRMFKGLEGLTYSFEKTIGGNMMGHLCGILITPFGFLFSLFSISDYPIVFTFVSVLNFSLCGLTMYLLLADIHGHDLGHLIFSTTYALIGFNVANAFQAVFFCAAAPLPIMVLGLRKLFQGKSPLLYIFTIAYGMATNAYFGFVLCVASVLFFFAELWLCGETVRRGRLFLRYAVSSILGGLLACALWLPGFLSLQGGRLEQTSITDFSFWENMPFLQIGAKLFTGANNTSELVNGLPNIFVGILPLALVILYFINVDIDSRRKRAAGFLLGFYLISFWIVAINMLMHGGTTTNWFNYRYSYVFSFLLLLAAAEMWQRIEAVPHEDLKRCGIILALLTILVFYQKYGFVKGGAAILDLALLSIIFGCYLIRIRRPKANPRRLFDIITLLVVCINLFLNYRICTKNIMEWGITLTEYRETVEKVDPIVQAIKETDTGFYRMEINRQRTNTTGNDPMLYGYNGVGHGGSNERDFVRHGLSRIGIPWFSNRSYYADGIPAATDALLGIKYVIAEEDLSEEKGYQKVTDDENWNIYVNPSILGVAMLSTENIDDVTIDFEDVFDNLNRVWSSLSGESREVLIEEKDIRFATHNLSDPLAISASDAREIVAEKDASALGGTSDTETDDTSDSAASEISESKTDSKEKTPQGRALKKPPEDQSCIEYSWTASRDGNYYSYNRSGLSDSGGSYDPVLRYEGYYRKGEEIRGYLPVPNSYVSESLLNDVAGRFRAAVADEEALALACQAIQSRPVALEKRRDDYLVGDYASDADRQMLFTIPWDEGWTFYVDGEKTELRETLGLFMVADVPAGSHTFEMRFTPKGLAIGLKISIGALVLLVLYLLFIERRLNRPLHNEEAAADTNPEPSEMPVTPEFPAPSPINDAMAAQRVYALDFLKIVATLLIVLHHYQQVQKVHFEHGINFYGGRFYFSYFVELFFVLSGFFLYGYIERIRDGMRFSKFFFRRYLRFQPLQAISVVVYAASVIAFGRLYGFPWDADHPITPSGVITASLGIQSGWVFPNPYINNPTWFISVLLLCYVAFFLIVAFARRLSLPAWPFFALMSLLGIVLLSYSIELPFLNMTAGRGYFAFFWGLLLACLLNAWEPPVSINTAALCIAIIFPFVSAFANIAKLSVLYYSSVTLLFFTALIMVFRTRIIQRWFRSTVWSALAGVSFNVYMWHTVIFVIAADYFFLIGKVPAFNNPLTIACFLVVIYLFGYLSWRFIDRPMQRFVKKIL